MTGWRPGATLDALRERARVLAAIRAFFAARGVLEVETPQLCAAGSSDPHLLNFTTRYVGPGVASGRELYLQTSPEFAMKRLVAAGSGAIYQICKAYRNGEAGGRHNPEFTLVEWYRPGLDHHALMDEVEALLGRVAGAPAAERVRYGDLFRRRLDVDPHVAGPAELRDLAARHGVIAHGLPEEPDVWLELIFTHLLEPGLGAESPVFVHDYPVSQAMLARIRPGSPPVAERFELYWRGLELANGFHELADPHEQRRRFERDNAGRRREGLPEITADDRLLAALVDFPPSSGVALGLDRLLMAAAGAREIREVMAFTIADA